MKIESEALVGSALSGFGVESPVKNTNLHLKMAEEGAPELKRDSTMAVTAQVNEFTLNFKIFLGLYNHRRYISLFN